MLAARTGLRRKFLGRTWVSEGRGRGKCEEVDKRVHMKKARGLLSGQTLGKVSCPAGGRFGLDPGKQLPLSGQALKILVGTD